MDKKPPGGGERKKKKKESMKVVFALAVVLFRFCSFQENRFNTTSCDGGLCCGNVWAEEKTPRTRRGRKRRREGRKEGAKRTRPLTTGSCTVLASKSVSQRKGRLPQIVDIESLVRNSAYIQAIDFKSYFYQILLSENIGKFFSRSDQQPAV